jgi:hypothetical protein
MSDKIREYRGVIIFPRNVHGMYSARTSDGQPLAADTLAGMKDLIRHYRGSK